MTGRVDAGMTLVGLVILLVVILSTYAFASEVGDALTRNTVRLSLAWYTAAVLMMLRLSPDDWAVLTLRGRIARWCWTWGIVCFLVHLAMAFHFYHNWSHAHAFERTRQISGTGEGVYVSYLFTWLWIGDAVWWWARPRQYVERSPWIDRTLHAFMLFLVFNSMVVFETGPIRWAGWLLLLVLSAAWFASRRLPTVERA